MGDYSTQNIFQVDSALASRLANVKEAVWFRIGVLQSTMNDRERALEAFERVISINPANVRAMTQAGAVLAKKECYPQAVAYLQRAISADSTCGEAWAVLAHCFVMTDDLQKAYQAYQNALSHLPNPRDPNLWYGIGLLYDRYGSLEHALEAFLLVLNIAPDFERADEVCFCIGIIFKEQHKFDEALKYFNKVVVAANPPPPLTRADGWYQIGHVSELKRDIPAALDMYKQALNENPKHPKTLQNYGWLEHQHNHNSEEAIRLLKTSAGFDATDGQTWYLLGRVYMALREFRQAYDAYQQAVYRDGRNATFWCSIGVLYYQMNQYSDAMDAYSRAIKLNPYVSEVWYDLGTLYESCGQNEDAIEAYRRAAELAPDNTQITDRLGVLESSMNQPSQQHPQSHQPHQPQPQPQQPQQTPGSQQPTSQPISSGPQSTQHPQPPQLHPDMPPPASQPHNLPFMPMAGSRPFGHGPHQKPGQPHPSNPSFHSQPLHHGSNHDAPHHQAPPPRLIPPPSSSGPIDIPPIPSIGQPNISEGHPNGSSGGFQKDNRPNPPSEPLPALPPPSHSNSAPITLSPINPQSHPTTSGPVPGINAGPGSSGREHTNGMGQQTASEQHPAQPSSHPPLHESGMHQSRQGDGADSQPQNGPQTGSIPHMSSPERIPRISSPPKGLIHDGREDGRDAQQGSGYDPNDRKQSGSPGQLNHSALPSPVGHQSRPHPQMESLPQVQPSGNDGQPDKSDRPRSVLNAPNEDRDRNSAPRDAMNAGASYAHGDSRQRSDYSSQEQHENSRLPNLTRPGEGNEGSGTGQDESNQRVELPAPLTSRGLSQVPSRDRIPPMREAGGDAGSSGPSPPRAMHMHDVPQNDSHSHDENRRLGPSRHDEREVTESGLRDSQQNGRSDTTKQERLPGLSSLQNSIDMPSGRSARNEGEGQGSLPPVSAPSLALPPSSSLPSINMDDGKRTSSPSHAGSSPRNGGPRIGSGGNSLPPISTRNPSLSRLNVESKDIGPVGLSSGIGLGTSSLTKFGRIPATPVSNSAVPSSLPSPLPTRKDGRGVGGMSSSARSPNSRVKPSSSGLKGLSMPPVSSSYGQHDTVPSPGSLPVLSAVPSRPDYSDEEKSGKEKPTDGNVDMENERPGENRSKFEEKVDKEESGGHGRGSEDVLDNTPVFGVLRRPDPSPVSDKAMERSDNEEKMKSPVSGRGNDRDSVLSNKRESGMKDESGRTPKRQRLHDVNEKELSGKPYVFGGVSDSDKGKDSLRKEDDDGKASSSGLNKSEMGGGFKDMKGDRDRRHSRGSREDGGSKHLRSDSGGRSVDNSLGKGGLGGEVMDFPSISKQSVSKIAVSVPPPLRGNTPLPSYESERKNMSASRGGVSSGGVGKSHSSENPSRGSVPFALRSAPIGPLKSLGGGSSGRGSGDRSDYESSPRMGDNSTAKRVGEDKGDGQMSRSGGRERD